MASVLAELGATGEKAGDGPVGAGDGRRQGEGVAR
jgi:hypothetical protein